MELSPRVTIRDVAARAGVSVATVSKVINGRYGVSAATVARVQAVIDETGYEAKEEPPTAIFAANDVSAIATVEVAHEWGLRVPQELSVVGFDNIPESALCEPPLTTVEQPIHAMGQLATEMVIKLIRGERVETTHATLATRLLARQSTAAR